MEQAKIDRINELSKKSKTVGLTPDEKEEQAALREEYIISFRASLKGILDNTVIERPDGSREHLKDRAARNVMSEDNVDADKARSESAVADDAENDKKA